MRRVRRSMARTPLDSLSATYSTSFRKEKPEGCARGLGEGTFPVTAQAAADGVLHRAAGAEDEDAVVPRVGDHDPPVRGGGDLAGKGERPVVAPLGFLQAEWFGRKGPVGARLREL